jgi:hypothetical protein
VKTLKKMIMISFIVILGGIWLTGCNSSNQPSQTELKKAIQDDLDGFSKIEKDVKIGDYNAVRKEYEEIHTVFHAMILDKIKSKLGNEYGENVHGKVGILAESIMSQDRNEVEKAIQLNRDSMHTVAKDMGIKLTK